MLTYNKFSVSLPSLEKGKGGDILSIFYKNKELFKYLNTTHYFLQ